MYTVRVEADFSAAHCLSGYPGRCENLHGHNYRVRACVRGVDLDESGMLMDFGVLKSALRKVCGGLDHRLLNEEPAFRGSPSAERIARYIFEALASELPGAPLAAVEVFESDTSMCRYEP
ncbi:MAG TPA: 6-carboxytetrahydropterin synthase QueD [Magnetospirillaceae bacterium]|nr:6-carboxytetrahydropterin synthase QueD [Magnetospirillaceae bacterium]